MKIKLFLIAALAGVALVGCNRDNGLEDKGDGGNRYMGFSITMPSLTKAETTEEGDPAYVYGSEEENAIKTVYFYFYKDGTYVSYGEGESSAKFNRQGSTDATVEELWQKSAGKGVVVIESNMHTKPNQMLCLINIDKKPEYFRNKTLADALDALQTGVDGVTQSNENCELGFAMLQGDGSPVYFAMANSPIVVGGKEQYIVPIKYDESGDPDLTNIFDNPDDAEDNPVHVYVERLAAKVEVKHDAAVVADDLKEDWVIEIDAWGLNGVSQNAYSVKRIDASWIGSAFDTPSWVLAPATDGDHRRINWAIDPHYSPADGSFDQKDNYPRSARNYGLTSESDPTSLRTKTAYLKYWSMKQISDRQELAFPKYDKLRQMYALENTFDSKGQNDARYVGTHVIVLATLKQKDVSDAEDLFSYMGNMYTLSGYQAELIHRASTEFDVIYVKDGSDYRPLAGGDLEIKKACKPAEFDSSDPDKKGFFALVEKVAGSDEGYSDGFVTLYPKDVENLYKKTADDPATYEKLTAAEIKDAFLKDIIDIALGYKGGAMWYCVPIEHLGKAKNADDELLEGNYGLVRNHWYKMVIKEIATIGHGIWDPNEPIVPDEKAEKWYLAAQIHVNAWHMVEMNDVVLAE